MYPKIDAYNLRLFEAIAKAGSIASAARSEHIAPSAMSRRLAELEGALKTTLFVRSPRGLELTAAGHAILRRATCVNAEIQALVREAWGFADNNEVKGLVRLWTNPSGLIGYLPELLQSFALAYPRVDIELVEDDTAKVIRACLEDRADVGVGVSQEVQAGLDSWFFAKDPLHVLCMPDHPLLSDDTPVAFARVLDHPLLSVRLGGTLDGVIRRQAQRLNPGFRPRLTVSSIDALCRLVEVGMGVAVLPQSMLAAYAGSNRFATQPLAESWADRDLSLYSLRKQPRTLASQAFINHVTMSENLLAVS